MTVLEAIRHAYRLQSVWVGQALGATYNLDAIQKSIRSELAANKKYPARCTEECKRETRGAAILLGKVRKALRRGLL